MLPQLSTLKNPGSLHNFYHFKSIPSYIYETLTKFVLFVTFIRYAASVQSLTFIKSIKKNHFHVS